MGQEAEADGGAVVAVTGEAFAQELFFIEEAEDDDEEHGREHQQSPPGAEGQGVPSRMSDAPAYIGWRTTA